MKTREQLRACFASLLRDLRRRHGLSKSKMADLLYIDDHTWSRYESGESAPSVSDFAYIFSALQEDALLPVLDAIYDGYKPAIDSHVSELRRAGANYLINVASGRTVRALDYILLGGNGSNIEPKMQEFLMLEHLPLCQRVAVAYMIQSLYKVAQAKGDLIGTEHIMPDMKIFEDGLAQAERASVDGKESYTTFVER